MRCSPPGSRPLPVSIPSPDVVLVPALIPCLSASALACHLRRRCRFSSLARQHLPSPAVVVAACSRPLPISVPSPAIVVALVPCPSASALACHRRCRRFSSLARQRPPLPAVVIATGSRPLPVSVRPCLTSLPPPVLVPCPSAFALACCRRRRRFSSLARQHPPLPDVIVAAGSRPLPVSVRPRLPLSSPPVLVPCPSASALA
jgi:hypothetical protein